MRVYGAAVHFHQAPHQRQSNAQSVLGGVRAAPPLVEHVKDEGQHVRRDSSAVVLHGNRCLIPAPFGDQANEPTSLGILGGVVQQVGDDLREAGEVAIEEQRLWWLGNDELVPESVDQGTARLYSGVQDVAQSDPIFPKLQLAAGNASEIQQIVHQPGQLLHLALDDVERPLGLLGARPVQVQHELKNVDCVSDRRQRIAKLVRQRRKELVLAPIRLAEGVV